MTAGQDFVRMLKPAGCAIFLIIFVSFLVICFTAGGKAPVSGYLPPHDTEYYSSHLDELCTELEDNLLPQLGADADCSISGERITVKTDSAQMESVKNALTHYYTDVLFEFEVTD